MPRKTPKQAVGSTSRKKRKTDLENMGVYVWTSEGAKLLETSAMHVETLQEVPYGASAGFSFENTGDLIRELKHGFPMSAFENLRSAMDIPAKTLSSVANIASRTLSRRKKEGRLQTDESERLFRIAALYDRAVEVLGDGERARAWFKGPKKALGGKTPLQYADTEPGAREVENLLGRLEYGVFS
jgi:putative toxin-antitoxin system antitoxin component (TIGR02293 family)